MSGNNGTNGTNGTGGHTQLTRLLIANARKVAEEAAKANRKEYSAETTKLIESLVGLLEREHVSVIDGATDRGLSRIRDHVDGLTAIPYRAEINVDVEPMAECVGQIGDAIKELRVEADMSPVAEAQQATVRVLEEAKRVASMQVASTRRLSEELASFAIAIGAAAKTISGAVRDLKVVTRTLTVGRDRDGRISRAVISEG